MMRIRSSIIKIHKTLQNSSARTIEDIRTIRTSASVGNSTTTESSHSSTSSAVDTSREPDEGVSTTTRKLAPRSPLVKSFFVGTVDKELLPFPEVVKREELASLQQEVKPLEQFFKDQDNTKNAITPEFIEDVRKLGLFGINVAQTYHGKGWSWSESLYASEPESMSTDLSLGLLSHRVVIDLLQEVGKPAQKEKLLPQLAKGSLIASEAVYEYEAPEHGFFNTKAEYCIDTRKWTISGEKAFVVTLPKNGEANFLYLVIVETNRLNMTDDGARATTIFLLDSRLPGVSIGEQHETIGCRGVPTRRVRFDRVEVDDSCILGELHEGNKMANILLRSGRLRSSMTSLGLAKSIFNELSLHCAVEKHCGVNIKDMQTIKTHLSKSLCATYATESMLYYTAGLLDEFDNPDVFLEAAILKYFGLKELLALATRSMDIIGPKSLHAGRLTEQAFRDAAQLYTQGETMDTLCLFIALSGLQYAGTLINDSVRMSRNPLFHPKHFLGKLLSTSTIENPHTKMRLGEQLHPTLDTSALSIEHSIARLQMCVDLLLIRYGNDIVERHNEMKRLAEIATMIFAMFASASRASRSYCIGLQFADNEILLASAICNQGRDLVKTLATEILNGEFLNNDKNLQRISSQIWKSKAYYPVHPLTYNF